MNRRSMLGVARLLLIVGVGASLVLFGKDRPGHVTLHVAVSGSDSASGTADHPLQSLPQGLKRLKDGDTIVLHAGAYKIASQIELAARGITIAAAPGETVVLEHGDFPKPLFNVTAEQVTIDDLIVEGRFVEGSGGIRGTRKSAKLTVRNCEFRNFTRHVLNVDGDGTVIDGCHIHHALWMHNGRRDDAHGIVTEWCRGLRIGNCRVHNVSGDCFQAGRQDWQDIVIEDCDFWDAPLEEAMAGFPAGAYTAENAVDTKVADSRPRGRLTLRRSKFHGFRSTLIDNTAALNLKEHADVVVDACVISDSTIGLRLRGTSRGGISATVVNTTIRDCDVGVRHEDDLEHLRFVHNTMYRCGRFFTRAPSRSKIGSGWIVANNVLLDASQLPDEFPAADNARASSKSFDTETLRPRRLDTLQGRPVAKGLPTWYGGKIDTDQASDARATERPTMGAFERPGEAR